MDRTQKAEETDDRGARMLLLYADAAQAVAFVQRLSKRYELISSPLSAPMERWVDELEPDLVLLSPPSEPKQLLQTCESVRAKTERPLVVLSQRGAELLVTRALAIGIDEYLVLPIGDRVLAARIDALLRRMQRNAGLKETRQVGGLVLSSADHSVSYDGRTVFLSPIEFRLLACLASAPGKVLTHQTLMSRVWGAEYVDSRHYLRVYVRYLREKLEADPTKPQMIVSEWGVGYRLQPPDAVARDRQSVPSSGRAASYGVV